MLRLTEEQMTGLRNAMKPLDAPQKKAKYRNHKTKVDGITFASKLEAKRYSELVLMQKAGLITELARQVRFKLEVHSQLICYYIADFTYRRKGELSLVVEDAKGFQTKDYLLKKKVMWAIHGISVQEVKAPRRARKS